MADSGKKASLDTVFGEQHDDIYSQLIRLTACTWSTGHMGQFSLFLIVLGAVFLAHFVLFRVVPLLYKAVVMYVVCAWCGPLITLRQLGTWAVVTGCTDGIGKAYAEELACKGLNIVLVSRNPEKLSLQAEYISETYGVRTRTIVADFSQTHIYSSIAIQLDGLDIAVLVNNVGVGSDPQYFLDTEDKMEVMPAMININIYSVTMMTAVVLPSMVAKKKGVVINVASAAGCRPVPFLALYSSTKAMVINLTEALHEEYSGQGIIFQAVTPFLVSTKMTNLREPSGIIIATPNDYVRSALSMLGVCTITPGYFWHDLQYVMMNMVPKIVIKQAMVFLVEQKGNPHSFFSMQREHKHHLV